MANHKSAKKCIKQIAKRTAINRDRLSRIRTIVKKAEVALGMHKQTALPANDAVIFFNQAQKELMRGVIKGVLHRNTASRKVSRLAHRLKAID